MIKLIGIFSVAILATACTAATARAGEDTPTPAPETPQITSETPEMAPPAPTPIDVVEVIEIESPATTPYCDGVLTQGGLVICHAEAGSTMTLGATQLIIANNGQAHFGLNRAAPSSLSWTHSSGATGSLNIAKRDDKFRNLTGLDCDKVDARSEAQKAHAGQSWVKKQAAFALINTGSGAEMGFVKPTDAPTSSPFGPTRKYTGVSKVTGESCEKVSVHRGYDMAAPIGTPVVAPADGTVVLGEPDLYYEGGTVFLDHGHGLVSVLLHLSSVDVSVGDEVKRGDIIAKTGNSGRTTGPHLHWAVKWRNPSTESRQGDFYIDPALLLELPRTPSAN